MYGDITTRHQRMSRVDWFRIVTDVTSSLGKVLLLVVTIYVLMLAQYVVAGLFI